MRWRAKPLICFGLNYVVFVPGALKSREWLSSPSHFSFSSPHLFLVQVLHAAHK